MKKQLAILIASCAFFSAGHAGIIETLLGQPAIQALIGRQDLASMVQRCTDAAYRKTNQAACRQLEEANRLARIPTELRVLLAKPVAAASLREICLAAQGTTVRGSYLCKELANADLDFAALANEAEAARQRARSEDQQLGR